MREIEEQIAVKRAIIKEFNMIEKKVSQSWLDTVDCIPEKHKVADWTFLLYSKEYNVYVNLRFFPKIKIEPTHTDSYSLGVIYYKKTNMDINDVIRYMHNILDENE
jgi:hypothetical protein